MPGLVTQTWEGTFGAVECRIEVRRLGNAAQERYAIRLSRLAYVAQGGESLGVWAVLGLAERLEAASSEEALAVAVRRLEALFGRFVHEAA